MSQCTTLLVTDVSHICSHKCESHKLQKDKLHFLSCYHSPLLWMDKLYFPSCYPTLLFMKSYILNRPSRARQIFLFIHMLIANVTQELTLPPINTLLKRSMKTVNIVLKGLFKSMKTQFLIFLI